MNSLKFLVIHSNILFRKILVLNAHQIRRDFCLGPEQNGDIRGVHRGGVTGSHSSETASLKLQQEAEFGTD